MTTHLPLLTNSRLRAFRRCPRLHDLSYNQGYRPVEKSYALRFGTLVHLGLEAWWKEPRVDQRLVRAICATHDAAEGELDIDDWDVIKAQELLAGYHHRWSDERWETIHVEHEFQVPLVHPDGRVSTEWTLAGKMDALARKDGQVYVVEHKTTTESIEPGGDYWTRLQMCSQISTYWNAAKELGYDIRGVLYDVLARPRISQHKATPEAERKYTKKDGRLYAGQRAEDETPEEFRSRLREEIASNPDKYYARGRVIRLQAEEESFASNTWSWGEMISEAQKLGRHPQNPESCKSFGQPCQFLGVCSGASSLDDTRKFQRLENVHEELNVPDAA